MEAAGLAVNIVSLYNAVVDILIRFDAYKNFATESRATIVRFEAAKIRLQDWADNVGIEDRKLASRHDPRLDDPRRASIIRDDLDCLKRLFDQINHTRSTVKLPAQQPKAEKDDWITPFDEVRSGAEPRQPLSKKSRIAWATGGKAKLNKDVVVFEGLVNALYHIADPKDVRAYDTLETLAYNDDQRNLSDLGIALANIRESLITLDQQDIINWLDAIDYQDGYDKHVSSHLNGTCGWILKQPVYVKWQASETTDIGAKFLWIHGPAGFGKTVLCAWLVRHVKETLKIPIAHCFSSSHAERSTDLDCIVRSWITQLAQSSIDILNLCQTARRKQSARRASKHYVWELLREIVTQVPSCILALDGLDEFPNVNDARSLFLESLKKAVALTEVKVLITSRNEIDIASEINVSASQSPKLLMLECKISKENVRADVHLYSQAAVARKFPRQSESFRQDISARLAENSGGMFLWVKLQQCQLRGSQNKKTVERIVEGMPQGLYQTYSRNWNSIQELPELDRKRATDILRWLTWGYRPLTVQELAEALVIELNDTSEAFCEDDLPADIDDEYIMNEIKGLCCSLVDIRLGSENWSPLPASFSTLAAPGFVEKEDCPIRCICGLQSDDDYLVLCEYCRTWQHIECYYFENGAMYDVNEIEHHCADCKPRHLDVRGANEHQRMRRQITQAALRYHETEVKAREPDTVHLAHISVRDYLVATLPVPMAKALPTQGSQSAAHHAMLAAYCLRFLDCPQAWSGSDDGDSRSFASYAARSWFWHLHNAEAYYDSVSGLVHSFMKPGNINFAKWRTRYETDLCIEWKEPIRRSNPSAMYYACSFGLLSAMDFLRNNEDEDIDSVGGLFGTALQATCSKGYQGAFDRLMGWGADVTIEGGRYHSAINAAACYGHCYMVKILLGREAQINAPITRIWEATRTAAMQGHADVVRLLLDKTMPAVSEGEVNRERSTYLSDTLLEVAASGHATIINLLLKHGADITARNHINDTPLHVAAVSNHLEVVKVLLQQGAFVDSNGALGSPLHSASYHGSREAVIELVTSGANIAFCGKDDAAPLYRAAANGHRDVVAFLLAHSANINAQTETGQTALYAALNRGYSDLARFLLQQKADVNIATTTGWRSIHLAAEKGLVDVLPLLIEGGADLHVQNSAGQSPLLIAAFCGQKAAAELLLHRGAEIRPDRYGTTPLHISTYVADLEITALFIRAGADPNSRGICGNTPLHMAIQKEDKEEGQVRLELVRFLLEQGALHSSNDSGWTPLHYAVRAGHNEIVMLLLDRGCHIDVQTNSGQTPLHVAIFYTKIDTADLLLRRGADANIATLGGETPLFRAVRIRSMDLVKSLISKGCDINAKRNLGETALREAIGRVSDELIEFMIENGADLSTTDGYQMTCSDWLRRLRPHLLKSQQGAQDCDKRRIGPDVVMLRRHTFGLAVIIRKDYGRKAVKLVHFVKCLLMLGMEDDARLAYQLQGLAPAYSYGIPLCDGCDDYQTRKVASYHCKSCPDTDLCSECMMKHKGRPILDLCREHEFMRAVASEAKIHPNQTEALDEWLCRIEEQLRPADGGEEVNEKIEGSSREGGMCE
ncbi:MAG: hypothetical protein Q9208_000159 [Pyrenodesmia sp. 3 TL-2023]